MVLTIDQARQQRELAKKLFEEARQQAIKEKQQRGLITQKTEQLFRERKKFFQAAKDDVRKAKGRIPRVRAKEIATTRKQPRPVVRVQELKRPAIQPTPKQAQIQKKKKVTQLKKQIPLKEKLKVKQLPPLTKEQKRIISGKDIPAQQLKGLKNIPKDVFVGLFEVTKELTFDPVKKAIVYGRNLRRRFDAGENNPLFNDVKNLATGTVSVSKFVKENPRESAAIVGLAVASGGSEFGNSLSSNPTKTVTKSAAYLFPGTVVKGGVKTVGLGTKGVKTVVQAQRLATLEKEVSPIRSVITLKQNNKLDKVIGSLSKTGDKTKINNKLNTFINQAAKDQKIKLPKTKDLTKKVNILKKETKVIKLGDVKAKAKVTKKQPLKPKRIIEIKKGKVVKVKKVSKIPKSKPKTKRDVTKFVLIEDGKLKRITKSEFRKRQLRISTKKQPPRPVSFVDLTKKKITKVSVDSPILKTKGIFKGKKGQLQFQRQLNRNIKTIESKVKRISKSKKPSLTEIKNTSKELTKLKNLVNSARINKIVRGFLLINKINSLIKTLDKSKLKLKAPSKAKKKAKTKDIGKKPARKQPTKAKTPAKAKDIGKLKKKSVPKPTVLKPRIKKPTIKKPKKPTPKKPKLFKIPKFKLLPKTSQSRPGYIIKIKKGNRVLLFTTQPLPRLRAKNLARRLTDNTIGASHDIIKKGTTKIKDVSKTILSKKFRPKKSKSKKVQKEVEKRRFRLDKKKEQKQIKGKSRPKNKKTVKVSVKKKKSSVKKRKVAKKRK